jgi:hypothetical protein
MCSNSAPCMDICPRHYVSYFYAARPCDRLQSHSWSSTVSMSDLLFKNNVYIYIYACVCLCVYVCSERERY